MIKYQHDIINCYNFSDIYLTRLTVNFEYEIMIYIYKCVWDSDFVVNEYKILIFVPSIKVYEIQFIKKMRLRFLTFVVFLLNEWDSDNILHLSTTYSVRSIEII